MLTYRDREVAETQRDEIFKAAGVEFAVIVESAFADQYALVRNQLFVPKNTANLWLKYDYRVRQGERVWEQSELDTPVPADATETELSAQFVVEYFPPSGPHFGDQVPEVHTRIYFETRGYWIAQSRMGKCELR